MSKDDIERLLLGRLRRAEHDILTNPENPFRKKVKEIVEEAWSKPSYDGPGGLKDLVDKDPERD